MSQVLALKYRPKKFEDIIGQDSVSNTLTLSLSNKRLSHAYIFSGLRGSGKTSTARIFSKALMCINGPTPSPCEVCENCIMANEGRHIDIIELDAASNRGIDDIKDLQEQVKYKPSIGKFKVFIIDEVHMLTPQAFNALLKTLEEPPEYVKFILATTDPLKIPATILSRTQHFRFKSISHIKIVHHLEHILHLEGIKYELDALDVIARSGHGSVRDTLTLLDQAIIYSKGSIDIQSVTEMLGLVDPKVVDRIFDAIFTNNTSQIKLFIKELNVYDTEMVIDELIIFLKEQMFENNGRYTLIIIERFFRVLSDAKQLLALNSDSEFVITLMFFKLSEALKLKNIDDAIANIENQINSTPLKIQEIEKPQQLDIIKESKITKEPNLFEVLIKKIYERNYDIGKCFEEQIEFVSFNQNTLTWKSFADGECKKILGQYYSNIKHLVKETYGLDTNIELLPISIDEMNSKKKIPKTVEVVQSASKEVSLQTEVSKPFDIREHPLVQKVDELFGIEGIIIKSK